MISDGAKIDDTGIQTVEMKVKRRMHSDFILYVFPHFAM